MTVGRDTEVRIIFVDRVQSTADEVPEGRLLGNLRPPPKLVGPEPLVLRTCNGGFTPLLIKIGII